MILTNWKSSVNTKFYSLSSKPKENTQNTEYLSGRVVAWKRNTKDILQISCKLMLKVDTELKDFWDWFNNDLGQTAGAFTCSALGNKYYRFVSVPQPDDTDTVYRVLSLEIEEVY